MTRPTLTLFPDTNLFVQCLSLQELDWQRFEVDEIELIVCRPVQSEIDHQKNRGGDRVAQRSRDASSLFRKIILGDAGYTIVRERNPLVKLRIEPQLRPAEGLNIDYSRADDRLVGIAAGYQELNPQVDVRVLTHDTGPMATARTIGVGLAPIPDAWLRPAEPSEADKTIKSLRDEVARLQSTEPIVDIAFAGTDASHPVLEGEVVFYTPLAHRDIEEQMERIRQSFPMTTEFSTPKPAGQTFPFFETVYEPPLEAEIGKYRSDYSSWLDACQKALEGLHNSLQRRRTTDAQFKFEATNRGTRPARDVLVTISAMGNFEILPIQKRPTEPFSLPGCPKPPMGNWGPKGFVHLARISRLHQRNFRSVAADLPTIRNLLSPASHDPNRFYWKAGKPETPTDKLVFECAQWRHGGTPEAFAGEIWLDPSQTEAKGALECIVEAENLSSPSRLLVRLRMVVARRSALDAAREAIDRMIWPGGAPAC